MVSRDAVSSERSAFAILRTIIVFAVLGLVLWPRVAAAQPLFKTEHDWTVTIDDRTFGLRQHLETTGGLRSTQVFLGGYEFHTNWLAVQIVAAAATGVIVLLALILWAERRYRLQKTSTSSASG